MLSEGLNQGTGCGGRMCSGSLIFEGSSGQRAVGGLCDPGWPSALGREIQLMAGVSTVFISASHAHAWPCTFRFEWTLSSQAVPYPELLPRASASGMVLPRAKKVLQRLVFEQLPYGKTRKRSPPAWLCQPMFQEGRSGCCDCQGSRGQGQGPVCPGVAALPPQSSSSSLCKSPVGGTGRGSLALSALPTASLALKSSVWEL